MKGLTITLLVTLFLTSCSSMRNMPPTASSGTAMAHGVNKNYEDIVESLFQDKDATISEENIQRILDGKFNLPPKLRVAIVNLENTQYRRTYWNDEDYLSSREKYLGVISENLKQQNRIKSVSLIPQILLPASPTFNSIREAAVRMQADVVLVYSVSAGIYSNYKVFKANEYKAFATTQVLMMDIRTGLVPFTRVVSQNSQTTKEKSDFNEDETQKRVQEKAVELTLNTICLDINTFLKDNPKMSIRIILHYL